MEAIKVCLWLLIAIFFCIMTTLFSVFIYKKVNNINSFNTNGVIFFKIDPEKKSVIRLSSKNLSGSMNFDDYKSGININETISLNDFLEYFDKKSHKSILQYVNSNNFEKRFNFFCKLNLEKFKNQSIKNVYKTSGINLEKKEFLLKFYPVDDEKSYYCNIHWNIFPSYNEFNMFTMLSGDTDLLKLPNSYYLSYALTINEYYFVNKLYNNDVKYIAKMIGLKKYPGWIYFKDGILQFIIGTNSYSTLKKFEKEGFKKIKFLNNNNAINPYFNNATLVSFESLNNKKDISKFNNKVKFLLQHLDNNRTVEKYGSWFLDDKKHDSHFEDYISKLEIFENKNVLQEYAKEPFYVYNYLNNKQTNIKLLKNRILGFTNSDMTFFKNIPWYKLVYTNLWNKYLLSNEDDKSLIILETNNADLKNFNKYNRPNTILMLKPEGKRGFSFELINNILANMQHNNKKPTVSLGLYINYMDDRLFNYIKVGEIGAFIISKDICNKILTEPEIYLRLQIFMSRIASLKKYIVIFENLPKNIENIIIENLKLKYYYNIEE